MVPRSFLRCTLGCAETAAPRCCSPPAAVASAFGRVRVWFFLFFFSYHRCSLRAGALRGMRPEIIMPCRCYTCGKPVGHLWEPWQDARRAAGFGAAKTLDGLGLKRYCCRRMLLSHTQQAAVRVHGSFMRPAKPV